MTSITTRTPAHGATPPPGRATAWLPHALVLMAVAALLALLAAVSIWQERQRQQERATAGTQNLARLLEAQVADVLNRADVLLQASALQWQSLATGEGTEAAAAALRSLAGTVPGLQNLRVADAQGRWRWSAAAMPAATPAAPDAAPAAGVAEAWQRLKADPGTGLLLLGPQRAGPDQPWVLVLGRAMAAADGRFNGMVSVELPIDRFDALLSGIDLGEGGAVTLRTDALALVYRRPWPAEGMAAVLGRSEVSQELREALAANPLAGDYEANIPLDGVRRINAYRKVQDYPLLLLVGLPESDFPGGWNAVDTAIVTLAGATLALAALATVALQRLQRRALGDAQRRLAAIVEGSQDAIVSETRDGVITSWNSGAERLFGHSAAEMLGQSLARLVPDDRRAETADLLAQVYRGEPVAHFETERLCRDGRRLHVSMSISPVQDAQGRVVGHASIARDMTLQKAMAEEVRQLAFIDPLTRLPNRRLLMDRLRQAQQTSRRTGTHGAVLFLDLDGFKQLNDRLGHEAGDQCLVTVARRLREAVRETDTVARLGGDEFVVVCENLGGDAAVAAGHVAALQAKIGASIHRPMALATEPVQCEASIGQRLFLGAGDDPMRLLADADAAMYRHKQQRRPPVPAAVSTGLDDEDDGTL